MLLGSLGLEVLSEETHPHRDRWHRVAQLHSIKLLPCEVNYLLLGAICYLKDPIYPMGHQTGYSFYISYD